MNVLFANAVVDFFIRGGLVMWPILFSFVAALIVIIERSGWWWSLSRRTSKTALQQTFDSISAGDFENAAQLAQQPGDPYLGTVHEGLLHAHTSMLGAMQLRATSEIEKAES